MTIRIAVHANEDDALIAWRPDPWPASWVGFALAKRNTITGEESTINNRIPPKAGAGEVPAEGIASTLSPIRRCLWTDHSVDDLSSVGYRVTPIEAAAGGTFKAVDAAASDWTAPIVATAHAGD